jgi:hypothetical protein
MWGRPRSSRVSSFELHQRQERHAQVDVALVAPGREGAQLGLHARDQLIGLGALGVDPRAHPIAVEATPTEGPVADDQRRTVAVEVHQAARGVPEDLAAAPVVVDVHQEHDHLGVAAAGVVAQPAELRLQVEALDARFVHRVGGFQLGLQGLEHTGAIDHRVAQQQQSRALARGSGVARDARAVLAVEVARALGVHAQLVAQAQDVLLGPARVAHGEGSQLDLLEQVGQGLVPDARPIQEVQRSFQGQEAGEDRQRAAQDQALHTLAVPWARKVHQRPR